MSIDFIADIVREAFIVTLRLALPSLLVALFTGFIIGLFQALTSIQEATLTFVPKMVLMLAVLWVGLDNMSTVLSEFFRGVVLAAVARI